MRAVTHLGNTQVQWIEAVCGQAISESVLYIGSIVISDRNTSSGTVVSSWHGYIKHEVVQRGVTAIAMASHSNDHHTFNSTHFSTQSTARQS